jgi:hypothetical protein
MAWQASPRDAGIKHNPAAALRPAVEPVQRGGFESLAHVVGVQGPDLGQVRLECLDRAVKAEGVGDHCSHTAGGHQARDAPRRSQARRQRLLEEQGLARPACRLHDGGVKHRRDRHDQGFHARVGHEIMVVAVKSAAISRGELLPLRDGSVGRRRRGLRPSGPLRCGGRSETRACRGRSARCRALGERGRARCGVEHRVKPRIDDDRGGSKRVKLWQTSLP